MNIYIKNNTFRRNLLTTGEVIYLCVYMVTIINKGNIKRNLDYITSFTDNIENMFKYSHMIKYFRKLLENLNVDNTTKEKLSVFLMIGIILV